MRLDEFAGLLVVKVPSLFAFERALCSAKVARRLDEGAIRDGGEVSDAQVNPDLALHCWQGIVLVYFAREHHIPLPRLRI